MHEVFENIESAFDNLAELEQARNFAYQAAIGVWADDPLDPGASAVVWQGKLFSLALPDSYLKLSADELTHIVNNVIINAFVEWRKEYDHWFSVVCDELGLPAAS